MTTSRDHTELCAQIRLAINKTGRAVIWLNPVGFTEHPRKIRFGLARGSADLIGLNEFGRFLALEVKTGNAGASKLQKLFLALVRKLGGYARVVRSVEDALEALEESLVVHRHES